MNQSDIVSIAIDLIAICNCVPKRVCALTGETKFSGDPTADIAFEATVLAKDLEHLQTILTQYVLSESSGTLKHPIVSSLGTIDDEFRRIFQLCHITLNTLLLELDKIGGAKTMKEFLRQLRVYREMLDCQIQFLKLDSADNKEMGEILRRRKEATRQLDYEEKSLRQRYPAFFPITEDPKNKLEYPNGSRATASSSPLVPALEGSGSSMPFHTGPSESLTVAATESASLLSYGRNDLVPPSLSHAVVSAASTESAITQVNQFMVDKAFVEEKMVNEKLLNSYFTEDIHDESLETLMVQHSPYDLSGEVHIVQQVAVASGGFGTVYRGNWKAQLVAIKILKTENSVLKHNVINRRLTREINVWAALSHPNIVPFYGYVSNLSNFPAMVSKWCVNGNAGQFLQKNTLTLFERIGLETQTRHVADGLAYLHSLKIIHGDLKPPNVLIDENRVAQLCDFGLVRLPEWTGPVGINTSSPYMGTPRYQALECFPSKNNLNPLPTFSSDIYALGCVIFEFIHVKYPYFEIKDLYQAVEAIKRREPPAQRPDELLEDSTDKLYWDLLDACWHLDHQKRPKVSRIVKTLEDIKQRVEEQMASGAMVEMKVEEKPMSELLSALDTLDMSSPEDVLLTNLPVEAIEKGRDTFNTAIHAIQAQLQYIKLGIPPNSDPVYNELVPELIKFMIQRPPKDLTGDVNIPSGPAAIHGGFSSIYLGSWAGQTVAIKVLQFPAESNGLETIEKTFKRRLNRQIRVWAALKHPNIPELYGFIRNLGYYECLISRWYPNGNSHDYLYKNPTLTAQKRLHLVQGVADALVYLHSLGIIHGNITPENILVANDGTALLCGLGSTMFPDLEDSGFTSTSPYGGTARYMAKELLPSRKNPTPKPSRCSDVYSLGCVTFEIINLEGEIPYHVWQNSYMVAEAIREGNKPSTMPRERRGETLSAIWDLLEESWDLEWNNRPTAGDYRERLQGIGHRLNF